MPVKVHIGCSQEEADAWRAAAQREGASLAAWVRAQCDRAAGLDLVPPPVTLKGVAREFVRYSDELTTADEFAEHLRAVHPALFQRHQGTMGGRRNMIIRQAFYRARAERAAGL